MTNTIHIQNPLFSQSTKQGNKRNDKYNYDNSGKQLSVVTNCFKKLKNIMNLVKNLLLRVPVRSGTNQPYTATDDGV